MSNRNRTRKSLRARPAFEHLEERAVPANFRSFDGTGNNANHLDWGRTGVSLLRIGPDSYGDGMSTPTIGNDPRPSGREISNTIVDQGDQDIISNRQLSAMVYAWGQFIDHDMDLTTNASPAEPFDIPVPTGDPYFDPSGTGTQVINLNRSKSVAGTGTTTDNPRQQPNEITSFLDASMVYGSSDAVADALRTHRGGLLKTSPGADGKIGTADDLLPFNNLSYFTAAELAALHMGNDAHRVPDDQLFAAGDIRANENIELSSLHTLFVREHNRFARAIAANNPRLGDEAIYQRARALVIAEIESITFNEWLPAVLGANALPAYTGYKPGVNPGIANEFSTALFRLGHSMLGDDVEFLDNRGLPLADEIPLSEAFSNPPVLQATGIDPILKYLASDPSSEVDNTIVNSVRNFLFGAPGSGGFDLASLNIQRGRDHGLASYNDAREAYGLSRVSSFSDISSDPTIQAKLQELYGNVDNIDLWVGALAEDHVAGSSTGELIRAALIDQFTRLRDGDSFWFERTFSGTALSNLEKTSLSDLIRRNTGADVVQDNVFFFRASISGTVFNDSDRDGRQDRGEGGLAGRTIQLYNVSEGDPELVAETTTNRNGNYRFDIFDGLRTGNYQVVEVVPSGWKATTANPRTVNIPRGQTFLDVDFGNVRTFTAASPSSALGTAGSTNTGASPSAGFAATPGQAFLPADGTAAAVQNTSASQPTTSTSHEVNQLPVDDSTTSTGTASAPIAESEPAPLLIQPISGMDEFTLLGPIGV